MSLLYKLTLFAEAHKCIYILERTRFLMTFICASAITHMLLLLLNTWATRYPIFPLP